MIKIGRREGAVRHLAAVHVKVSGLMNLAAPPSKTSLQTNVLPRMLRCFAAKNVRIE